MAAGTTVAQVNAAPPPVPVAPGVPNSLVVANHGVVDIALSLPTGAPVTRTIVTTTNLSSVVSGAGVTTATLFAEGDHCQLTFAVDVGGVSTPFDGSLRITVQATGGDCVVDLPLQVRANTDENGLFIPCTLVRQKARCTWVRVKCVSQTGGAAVATGTGTLGALRDNSLVRGFNRLLPLRTVTSGHVARPDGNVVGAQERTTMGVPIDLPLTFDVRAGTFVRRVHLLEFTSAQRTGHHNNNPHLAGDMQLQPVAAASLATRTFFLDPGHGVNYADADRRCYEWFLAHRIVARVAGILRTRHGVPAAPHQEVTKRWGRGDCSRIALGHLDLDAVPLRSPNIRWSVASGPRNRCSPGGWLDSGRCGRARRGAPLALGFVRIVSIAPPVWEADGDSHHAGRVLADRHREEKCGRGTRCYGVWRTPWRGCWRRPSVVAPEQGRRRLNFLAGAIWV